MIEFKKIFEKKCMVLHKPTYANSNNINTNNNENGVINNVNENGNNDDVNNNNNADENNNNNDNENEHVNENNNVNNDDKHENVNVRNNDGYVILKDKKYFVYKKIRLSDDQDKLYTTYLFKLKNGKNLLKINLAYDNSKKQNIRYFIGKQLEFGLETNSCTYADLYDKYGPPYISNVSIRSLMFLDNIYGYLMNIGVISHSEYLNMENYITAKGTRRISDFEILFLTSSINDMFSHFYLLKREQKMFYEFIKRIFPKLDLDLRKIPKSVFDSFLNSEFTSEFHSFCMLSYIYRSKINKIKETQINRLPLHLLLLTLFTNEWSDDVLWKCFYRIKELIVINLNNSDIDEYQLSYPMNTIFWLSKMFEFKMPEFDDNGKEIIPVEDNNEGWIIE